MGAVYASIQLSNDLRPDLDPVEVSALVDSGAINLCIPESVKMQLGLETRHVRTAEMADGSTRQVDVVAPVTVVFKNRETTTTAMVLGNEVLLGAIAMQDLDVLIDPRTEQLVLPPDRPNFALTKVKNVPDAKQGDL
ncbi:MAG TPA: clan AA aspartic protease [Allosphingosinicella sp.]|nr:clan AA aspartic protease [Allosphingosinicella sp.]